MNRLKALREKSGKAQKEVAIDLCVSQPTISDWEAGRKTPSSKSAARLADYFGVSLDYLIGRDTESKYSIPVVGMVPAGIPIEAIEDVLDYEEITPEMARMGDLFGLRVKGDSMEPRIKEGDVLIIRKQDTADTGDIVIAFVNGDNEATVKKFVKHENGISLIPNNHAYEPMFFTFEEVENLPVRIVGKVVELRGKF